MAQRVFQLVNKLDHINLVKLDYFYEDGYFYVVREYRDDYVKQWLTFSSYDL